MAFCPNLPLPTVQAGAEGPQAAEIKNDFLGTVGMSHPMDGYRPCRHWPPVSMATARLQENKWAVGLWIGASLGDREGLPRPSEGTWQAPPIPHPPLLCVLLVHKSHFKGNLLEAFWADTDIVRACLWGLLCHAKG